MVNPNKASTDVGEPQKSLILFSAGTKWCKQPSETLPLELCCDYEDS